MFNMQMGKVNLIIIGLLLMSWFCPNWLNAQETDEIDLALVDPCYTQALISHEWEGGGAAQGWKANNTSWLYTLPFPFPFFECAYTRLYVHSNGYVDFTWSSYDNNPSFSDFLCRKVIAVLWEDLDTTNGDIFINERLSDPVSNVVIRWQGEYDSSDTPINVELVLFENGKIQVNYGDGNTTSNSGEVPLIGITNSDGNHHLLSFHDGDQSLDNAESETYTPDAVCDTGYRRCPSSINFGETVICSIDSAAETDMYSFSGEAGDRMSISMSRENASIDPQIRVYRGASLICENYTGGESVQIADCLLPESGTYVIQARDYGITDVGDYSLHLQRLNNPGNTNPIGFDEALMNQTDLEATAHYYSFCSEAYDVIQGTLASDGCYFDPRITVFDPNGTVLCSNYTSGVVVDTGPCEVTETGNHTIKVDDWGLNHVGPYTVNLGCLTPPCGCLPPTCIVPCEEDESGSLNIVEIEHSGTIGSEGTVTVEINSAPNMVGAMGFEVAYDSSCLEYVDYEVCDLTSGFDFFECTLQGPGVVRCGGFTSVNKIPQGASGCVVKLAFDIVTPDLDELGEAVRLDLQALVDDVDGWSTSPGYICVGCSCDVSGDGNITPQDALCAFEKYLGICPTSCGPCEEICCDVNGDGQCTPADALCIFQEYLGIGCGYCG